MTTKISSYPGYLEQVKKLVDQHLELVEEPLLLAIYYAPAPNAPNRNPDDVYLFEVLDNFDASSIAYEGDLLEVVYGNTPHFMMHAPESLLHIILTSPAEWHDAAQRGTLIAPTNRGVFPKSEIEAHLKLANVVFGQAQTLIAITEREPR